MRPLEPKPAVIGKVHLKIDVQRVIIDVTWMRACCWSWKRNMENEKAKLHHM